MDTSKATMATIEVKGTGFHLTGYIMEDGSTLFYMEGGMRAFESVQAAVAYWRNTH